MGVVAIAKYTKAKKEANARYDGKTYRTVGIKLRITDDQDILQDLDEAHENGLNNRQWIRQLFEGDR